MEEQTVTYGELKLIVKPATVLAGVKRIRLRSAGIEAQEDDPDRRVLRIVSYPDLIAASEPVAGCDAWPIPFDDFVALPEPLVIEWEAAVYELNAHWLPGEPSAEEKKASPTKSTAE